MIKISHEVPKFLLNESLNWGMDYFYSLPHLMESDEEYRNFFLKCKEDGREIYLDNSLHELGFSLNDDVLLKWLNILEPSTFFVPDVWEDMEATIENAKRWIKWKDKFPKTTLTAVIQAKNLAEVETCYTTFKSLGYDKVAFSYGASLYESRFPHQNKTISKAMGRVLVINLLKSWGVIKSNDRIHLLGCSAPGEFIFYKDAKFIESCDSSNPIMAALDGTYYTDGFHDKPKSNMNDSFDIPFHNIDLQAVLHNVEAFKKLTI